MEATARQQNHIIMCLENGYLFRKAQVLSPAPSFWGVLNRRKFLKYPGATAALVGAAALDLNY